MVGVSYPEAYPVMAPQTFAPGSFVYSGGPPQPPPSGARQTVQSLAHTAGHAFASSAGSAVGHAVSGAAIGALLARVGGAGAMGAELGPAGVLGGAVVGLGGAALEMGVQMHRGGAGGNSAPTPVPPGSISGFRERGRPITHANVVAQQRGHITGGSTGAYVADSRTLNGQNEGHQPQDRIVRSRITPAAPAPVATVAPIATASAPAPAPEGPTQSGQDVYAAIVQNMAHSERERSPPRGDRRPLATQRRDAELMGLSGDARERAIALDKRDKVIPPPRKPATVEASSSSTRPPPPPPGAGAVKKQPAVVGAVKKAVQHFDIAREQVAGKKRRGTKLENTAKRKRPEPSVAPQPPPQPPPPPPPPRNRKRTEQGASKPIGEPNVKRTKAAGEPNTKRAKKEIKKSSNWKEAKQIWTKAR